MLINVTTTSIATYALVLPSTHQFHPCILILFLHPIVRLLHLCAGRIWPCRHPRDCRGRSGRYADHDKGNKIDAPPTPRIPIGELLLPPMARSDVRLGGRAHTNIGGGPRGPPRPHPAHRLIPSMDDNVHFTALRHHPDTIAPSVTLSSTRMSSSKWPLKRAMRASRTLSWFNASNLATSHSVQWGPWRRLRTWLVGSRSRSASTNSEGTYRKCPSVPLCPYTHWSRGVNALHVSGTAAEPIPLVCGQLLKHAVARGSSSSNFFPPSSRTISAR